MASSTNVFVAVRVRPLVADEQLAAAQRCVSVSRTPSGAGVIQIAKHSFRFDAVLDSDSRQASVFDACAAPLLDGVFSGYNATVFAYGQTGSGKTFTMGTADQIGIPAARQGVIPRVVHALFDRASSIPPVTLPGSDVPLPPVSLRVSFIELYQERIRDLLHPTDPASTPPVTIRETTDGEIVLTGVEDQAVADATELLSLLETGCALRTTGATDVNEQSSRSHAILTVTVEQLRADGSRTQAKLHLVDLAGSERAKRTGAVGVRFKESVKINEGLLALGNVISALADPKSRRDSSTSGGAGSGSGSGSGAGGRHIPYRDSKLTRLLQDSLGGNSRTVMIACVSPADVSFVETLNTLRYAARARNIKNKPIKNVRTNVADVVRLRAEIEALQAELTKAHEAETGAGIDRDVRTMTASALKAELIRLSERLTATATSLREDTPMLRTVKAELLSLAEDAKTAASTGSSGTLLVDVPPAARTRARGSESQSESESHSAVVPLLRRELADLSRQCRDAKQDLARDEEIFRRKAETIAQLQSTIQDAYRENDMLRSALAAVEQNVVPTDDGTLALRSVGDGDGDGDGESDGVVVDTDPATGTPTLSHVGSAADIDFIADLQALDQQKQRLEADNARLEEEKARVEMEAKHASEEAQSQQHALESALRDFSIGIKLKEELIRTLAHGEREATAAAVKYHTRVTMLEEEVRRYQSAIASKSRVLADQTETETETESGTTLRAQTEDLTARLKKAETDLVKAKRAHDAARRVQRQQVKNKRRIRDLEGEVAGMKAKAASLSDQIHDVRRSASLRAEADAHQIKTLRAEGQAKAVRLKELTVENRRQAKLLSTSVGAPTRPHTAPHGPTERGERGQRGGAGAGAGGDRGGSKVTASRSEVDRRWRELEGLVKDCVASKADDVRLSRVVQRKAELSRTMDHLRVHTRRLQETIDLVAETGQEVDDLQGELRHAEESMEAAEAEAAYVDEATHTPVRHQHTLVKVASSVGRIPPRQAQALLRRTCEAWATCEADKQRCQAELASTLSRLEEASARVKSLETAFQRTAAELERRITAQSMLAAEEGTVSASLSRTPNVLDLLRDNADMRRMNQALRERLAAASGEAVVGLVPAAKVGSDVTSLTSQRDVLLKELTSLKHHLNLHGRDGTLEPVLVSRRDLRELNRDELEARRRRRTRGEGGDSGGK